MTRGKLFVILASFCIPVAVMWAVIWVQDWEPQLGLDLRGGVSITLLPVDDDPPLEVLDQTVEVIRQRIDALGVAEPDIARQGSSVLVQLPGLTDEEQAREIVGQTAVLQFRRVLDILPPVGADDPAAGEGDDSDEEPSDPDEEPSDLDDADLSCEELEQRRLDGPPAPGDSLVLCMAVDDVPVSEWPRYLVGPVEVQGERISSARAQPDPQTGLGWEVVLDFDSQGSSEFQAITGDLACSPQGSPGRQLAIVLDGRVESAPPMSPDVACDIGISGGARITVGGGQQEARDLAVVLQAGALPIQLDVAQTQQVSATLGEASLDAGLRAGLIGLLLVAAYMIALYRGIGIIAVAELIMFGIVVYGALIVLGETIGFTLTLAGIAGIIVSIGLAADSSIIYRERYRDEMRAGRTPRTAADRAFRKSFSTNLAGNTVSLIAAVVLYLLAVGPVRGFAFTLGLSTIIDTVLFGTFSRSLYGLVSRSPKLSKAKWMGLRADVVAPVVVGAAAGGAGPPAGATDDQTGGST